MTTNYKALCSIVLFLFVLIPMALGSIVALLASQREASIAPSERTAAGIIIAQRKGRNGIAYDYKFAVNGRDYLGHGYLLRGRPRLEVGESSQIYFDPSNPSTCSLEEYHALSENDHRSASRLCFVTIGITFVWLIYLKFGRWPSSRRP